MACTFHQWLSMVRVVKEKDKSWRKKSVAEAYSFLRAKFASLRTDQRDMISSLESCEAEESWYNLGCPYFKVWPRMARELAHVRIDISGEFLHLPFKTYEIRLPTTDNPMAEDNGPELKAILVQWTKPELGPDDGRLGTVVLHYQFDVDINKPWMGWYFGLPVRIEEKLEQSIERVHYNKSSHYTYGYEPSLAFCQSMIRISLAVAFFGIDRHEVVMPDLPRKLIDVYYGAKKAKDETEAAKILRQAKELGMFGWKVGSEIDLPTADVRYHDLSQNTTEEEAKTHLTYGHVRRAHMGMRWKGSKEDQHPELVYISSCLVRPDLPFREQHGYRIRHPVLERKI